MWNKIGKSLLLLIAAFIVGSFGAIAAFFVAFLIVLAIPWLCF